THVDEVTGNRCGRGHGRAHQMRTTAVALTTFEVTVGGGRAMFAIAQLVGVHGQTHGATRLTPLETSVEENLVQTFFFRLFFHQTRTRYHQRLLNSGSHFTAFGHFRSGAQVFDPGVGAGTDEHTVQLNAGHWLTGLQPHVLVGTLERRALHVVFGIVQRRYGSVDGGHHLG